MEAFEHVFAKGLDVDLPLDLGQDARRDENLPVLCLSAKPRSEIGRRTDRTVVEPLFEADCADRGVAAGDTDAKAKRICLLYTSDAALSLIHI